MRGPPGVKTRRILTGRVAIGSRVGRLWLLVLCTRNAWRPHSHRGEARGRGGGGKGKGKGKAKGKAKASNARV